MYPSVNQASAVLDALRLRLSDLGITELTGCRVTRIEKKGEGFRALTEDGSFLCRRLIVATGGRAGKGLGENESFKELLSPLGHKFSRDCPALTCLKTHKGMLSGLKGVRLRGEAALYRGKTLLKSEAGEVLFQDDGLSGIAVMQLSLAAAPLIGAKDLFVRLSPLGKAAGETVARRVKMFPERQAQQLLAGTVNRMIALNALKRSMFAPCSISSSPMYAPHSHTAMVVLTGQLNGFTPNAPKPLKVIGLM